MKRESLLVKQAEAAPAPAPSGQTEQAEQTSPVPAAQESNVAPSQEPVDAAPPVPQEGNKAAE